MDVYGRVVAEARQPAFFTQCGIEDTPEGRASMIILALFPVLDRLRTDGSARAKRIARYMSETFVADVDDSLREMGVGDLAVPNKVKRAAWALGERCRSYARAAKAEPPIPALAAELAATIPGVASAGRSGAEALARAALEARTRLAAQSVEELLAGRFVFPLPAEAATKGELQ